MNNREVLSAFSKDELIELIEIYSKNWLAMDGVWFQSVERKLGMDEAMYHDAEAWKRFTVIEAKRIKEFLKLPDNSGIDGLAKALRLRFYANINEDKIEIDGNTLTYTSVKQRYTLNNCSGDKRNKIKHFLHPPSLQSCGSLSYK